MCQNYYSGLKWPTRYQSRSDPINSFCKRRLNIPILLGVLFTAQNVACVVGAKNWRLQFAHYQEAMTQRGSVEKR